MKNRGSITIFSMISLLLITAALFALLEGTRLQEIRRFSKLQTENALESVFANYNLTLWESYHLLSADANAMEEILQESANGRTGEGGLNLLSFQVKNCEIEEYTLLTDGQGTVFIKSVSTYMKENLLYETAKEIYNQYESIKNLLNTSEVDWSNVDEALKEIESVEESTAPVSVGTSGQKEEVVQTDVKALLEAVKKWKENGILELVIEDTSKLSTAKCDFSNDLFTRQLKTGRGYVQEEVDWLDRILLQQYLLTYMSNYRDTQSGRALSYEAEYLLGGKSSDKENLQTVTAKLLAIREAANFLYLVSDPIKSQQAATMATMLGGPSLNPAIIEVIKIGLLTAWAFAESILDVRALLEGKKIPLLKSEETWTVELENIGSLTQEFTSAKESTWGIDYETYLGILLLFEEDESLAMHAMNAQEATIRKAGNPSFEMDRCITQASARVCYSYKPVFPFLQVLDAEQRWKYEILTYFNYGYYQ